MTTKPSPSDRKPKAGTVRLDGQTFRLRPDLDDDWEFIELLNAADESPLATIRIAKYILDDSPEAYAALKRECTEPNGRVSSTKVAEAIEKILSNSVPNS